MSQEQLVSTPNERSRSPVGAPRGSSNKKALIVTGVTMLAIVLVAGQAFTAYTVYQHSQKLSMLQTRSERLQEISRKTMANRTPVRLEKPMNAFPLLSAIAADEKDKPSPQPKKETMTKCQQEAAGLGQTSLISFRPQCDDQGAYIPQQCWQQATVCWCVDSNGIQLPDSVAQGSAQCNTDIVADK